MSESAPITSVYATFGSEAEAERIGRRLVEERLVACVNILGRCRSIYRWEGKIEETEEVAALFKTTGDGTPALLARLAELHAYDVPAAVAWPIAEALPAYSDWVRKATERQPSS